MLYIYIYLGPLSLLPVPLAPSPLSISLSLYPSPLSPSFPPPCPPRPLSSLHLSVPLSFSPLSISPLSISLSLYPSPLSPSLCPSSLSLCPSSPSLPAEPQILGKSLLRLQLHHQRLRERQDYRGKSYSQSPRVTSCILHVYTCSLSYRHTTFIAYVI